ncbi:MAG: transcriptional regulator, partial [Dinoroseobacter sp.]|nr:transcriptional regulator [Dinoroseobacter sp.]
MAALLILIAAALILAPNHFFNPELRSVTLMLGALGLWRFGWWFNHAIRAELFARGMWPDMRKAADRIWEAGWRPRRLHIQMTTYKENVAITRVVIGSIVDQVRREGIPTT